MSVSAPAPFCFHPAYVGAAWPSVVQCFLSDILKRLGVLVDAQVLHGPEGCAVVSLLAYILNKR